MICRVAGWSEASWLSIRSDIAAYATCSWASDRAALRFSLREERAEIQVMGGIFINYRRNDAPGAAGRLYDHLAKIFPRHDLFIDVDAIKAGQDFVQQLDAQVSRCDVMLAIIGPRWLSPIDDKGRRRLDEDTDYVRIEIASALKRNIPVIPVLFEGASMPSEDDLPGDIKSLARRHALELRHTRFAADADAIAAALENTLPQRRRGWVWTAVGVGALVAIIAIGMGVYQLANWMTQQGSERVDDRQEAITERAFTSFEPNTDLPGGDYTSHRLAKPDAILCQKLCAEDQRCFAWTYVAPGYQEESAVCWLKNTIPASKRIDACCTSGVAYYRRPN